MRKPIEDVDAGRLGLEEARRELADVGLDAVHADADVVEAVVGEQRAILLDRVAGHAAPLVQEHVEAAYRGGRQRAAIAT